jgi:Tol biopolymer transport system component
MKFAAFVVSIGLAASLIAAEPEKEKAPGKLPLKPERSVAFETDEGTWLSLDLSPDGKNIVFELVGDIYTLPVSGGEAKPLLTGMAMETQPRFSPDGKEIAFLSDRDGAENVWVVQADGSNPHKLSDEKRAEFVSPAWSPDGQYVFVSKSGSQLGANELWMYHRLGGGAGIQVTKSKTKPDAPRDDWNNDLGATFSPDGKFVYFARRKRNFSYNVTFPLWQLVRRNLVSGEEDSITDLAGSAFRPAVSPDGKYMVYATRYEQQTQLRVRDMATGDEHWLPSVVDRDDQESRATRDLLPGFAYTPDSKALIISHQGHIWKMPIDGSAEQQIAFHASVKLDIGPRLDFETRINDGEAVRSRLIMQPSASPDGKQVAFSSFAHIYVGNTDGSGVHRITTGDEREFQPSWSPDGKKIVYVTWAMQGGQIEQVDAAGGAATVLTQVPAFYRDPVFSPDGQLIYALHTSKTERNGLETEFGRPEGGLDLIQLAATGGAWRVVLPSRGTGRPHFGPEKDRIYMFGPSGLLSVRPDGTDQRTLLKVVGPNLTQAPEAPPATDIRISPDGTLALALVSRELWLLPMAHTGGTVTVDVSKPDVALQRLTAVGADSFEWIDGGRQIEWSAGAHNFHLPLDQVRLTTGATASNASQLKPVGTEFIVEMPRAKPDGIIALRGATAISMRGDEVIQNADIVITSNRITAIGAKGTVTIPAGAKVMNLAGMTIMPGIVDVHAHWTEVRRLVLDTNAWPFIANLAYGVTTGRDPQTSSNDVFAYEDLIDAGIMPGPRAYNTGRGIFSDTDFKTAEDAEQFVDWYAEYYHTNTVKSYTVGNRLQRQFMIEACKKYHIMPTTEGALDLKLDMTHAIDGFAGNEHALPIVPLYKDVVQLFAQTKINYTPTLIVAYGGPWAENFFYQQKDWYSDAKLQRFFPQTTLWLKTSRRPWFQDREQIFPRLAHEAGKIQAAGGRVSLGGHGQFQGIQCHWEMWAFAAGDIKPLDVLKIGTINGARNIGLEKDLGSLEPGKLADLIVLKKNPLVDIHNTETIRYVMKNGELFDGDTLDRLLPSPKKLPPMWWWNDHPEKPAPAL